MSELRPHRRQFILGPQPARGAADWRVRQVGPSSSGREARASTWLSWCPQLRAGWTQDADGTTWCLLGLALQTLDAPRPLAQVAASPSAVVGQCYASWAGRWLLIGRGEVHTDAGALLGCFYGRDDRGRAWASSSPALLERALAPRGGLKTDQRVLRYEQGLSWFPPPRSRYAAIRRVLPSQVLLVQSGSVRARSLLPALDGGFGFDRTLELLHSSLTNALRQLPEGGGPPWLGLSAGADSRLLLAIAANAGIAVRPFTRISGRMSVADRVLPPRLAKAAGFGHVFLRGHRPDPRRRRVVSKHSAGHVSSGDAEPLLRGVRDGLIGLTFGGHGFAIASGFAGLRSLPPRIDNPGRMTARILSLFGEPPSSSAGAGLREWLEWVLVTPHEQLDWRDRFFLEQRQGGWLSSKEQVYDLGALERTFVLNAARNHSLLLALPERQRLGSIVQRELIRRLAPHLLDVPLNPPDRSFGLVRAVALKSRDDPLYAYRKARAARRRRNH